MADRPLEGQVVGDDAIVARTTDGQQVIINGSVIFRLNQGEVVRIHQEWQERYIDELIRPRTRGQIRDTVAKFTVDEVNSIQRTNLEAELDEELEKILSEHGFELDTFVLRNITFSDQYGRSVELKQVQEQGQVTSLYEAEQIRRLASGHADAVVVEANARAEAIKIEAQANADARLIQADAQAKAHVIEAEARAEALRLIEDALAQDPENLLTYQYINRLSPNIKALLLPSDTPLVLPLQNNLLTEEDGVPSTQNPLLPQSELLPEDLSQESLLDDQIVPQPPTVTQPPVVTSTVGITQTGTITN
ncbi:MAG: SPFH domain-containing protein [Chloroflexota bacterium]